MRHALCAWLVWVVAAPATVRAAPDYGVENREWNGLSDLVSVAAGRGLTIEPRTHIDWSELGPSDVLFLVYPTTRVEPAHLAAFLRNGGRALIADDFGRADEALARLGILRRSASRAPRQHENNPNLPMATPAAPDHPLARGVTELATNHPTAFSVGRGPDVVFTYRDGEAVVIAGQLGKNGRFVALSDPSVLINAMLAFDGNLTFAVNLLDLLAPTRPGRIVLVTHEGRLAGEPVDRGAPDENQPMNTNELLAQLSQFLDELNDYLAPGPILHLLSAGIGGLALIFGLLLPLRRGRDPDANFARPGGDGHGLPRLLAELDDERGERSYAFPAALLREQAQADLEQRAAAPGRDRALAQQALALLRGLPEGHVSRRQFIEAHSAVTAARKLGHGH